MKVLHWMMFSLVFVAAVHLNAEEESIEVELSTPKKKWYFYEYPIITVRIMNKTNLYIALPEDALSSSLYIFHWWEALKNALTEEAKEPRRRSLSNSWPPKYSDKFIILPPNGYVCRSAILSSTPSEYLDDEETHKIWLVLQLEEKRYEEMKERAAAEGAILWTGKVKSNTIELIYVPPETDEDKELLEALHRTKKEEEKEVHYCQHPPFNYILNPKIRKRYGDHIAHDLLLCYSPFTDPSPYHNPLSVPFYCYPKGVAYVWEDPVGVLSS